MKLCRCCLTTNSSSFFDVFEEHNSGITYADSIRYLAEVQIEQNDGLSQQICFNCYSELHRIYEFCSKVQQADKKLRKDVTKPQMDDENQMENIQLLDGEYFPPVDDNSMQVCVVEDILENEANQEDILIVEEIHDVEEINVVEDISNSVKEKEVKSYNQKDNLLEGLALVAASQENVNIDKQSANTDDTYLPEDENDEDYLITFDPNETNNLKPTKWKCGECKIILRGDVSYEGHMNVHRQSRPHMCQQCETRYRCRVALKRHKDLKHSSPTENAKNIKKLILCLVCDKTFYSEITYCLHQAIVHCQGDKCPFECNDPNDNNLKQHLECTHEKDMLCSAETLSTDEINVSTTYQCFRCSETFEKAYMLQDHVKSCQTMDEERLQDDNINSGNFIEIVKVEESEDFVECNVCQKNLLKRNLKKHMNLHKRKEEENKTVDDPKEYLCSFCHKTFKSLHDLDKHLSLECEHFVNLNLLKKHKKVVHKSKCLYMCKVCGNLYGGRAQLSAHKKLHKERPFKCDQCDKAYPRKVELQIHMRTHTGELPYECHLCDKRFAIKVRLTYHLQKHEGITHTCTYCSAVYNSRNKLKAHLFKHTGMPYKCDYCPGIGFERRIRFANHMKKVHQKILTEEELTQVFAKNTGKIVHFKDPVIKEETIIS